MKRMYEEVVRRHLRKYRQMLFLMGPRQIGKTTTSQVAADGIYLTWDDAEDRAIILAGTSALARHCGLEGEGQAIIVLDEIHKYANWKNYLKGFFDKHQKEARIVVTGSARLDVYRAGQDSLMGRYFHYRLHPMSVREIIDPSLPEMPLRPEPHPIDEESWEVLWRFGGFPEPFLKREDAFYAHWKRLRFRQLFREDIRDLTRIHELEQFELLAELLRRHIGQLTSYTTLAKHTRVSVDTVRRWIEVLKGTYYCFALRPWTRNVGRSLLKEPKYYLYDWSLVQDEGARFENLVASHLLKAVHCWNDLGMGEYGLYFLRTKEGHEVDFLVTAEDKPWILVEAKRSANQTISPALKRFHEELGTEHALEVVRDLLYSERSCFGLRAPRIVSARTFLSQLV